MNEFCQSDAITGKKGINRLNKKLLSPEEMDEIFLNEDMV